MVVLSRAFEGSINEKRMIFWPPDGQTYPGIIKKVFSERGLIEVEFDDYSESSDEQNDNTFFVSPACIGAKL